MKFYQAYKCVADGGTVPLGDLTEDLGEALKDLRLSGYDPDDLELMNGLYFDVATGVGISVTII